MENANVTKKKKEKPIRIWGVTFWGKNAVVRLTSERVEVRTTSTLFITFISVLFMIGFAALSLIWNILIFTILSVVLGGVFSYILTTRYYNGKKIYDLSYGEIVSFVADSQEFTINLKNNQQIPLRMPPKRQKQLAQAVEDALSFSPEYQAEKMGAYCKVRERKPEISE